MLNETQIRQIIKDELQKFKEKNLGFRSWLKLDTPTDTYTVGNKGTTTGASFLPITGGTLSGNLKITGNVGFYNTNATTKQEVTGSREANAALTSLLTALATIGLITNSSS